MLPDKVYARYYVEDCDVCSDGEINRADDDFAECGECQCNMCSECLESMRCVVCDEREVCSEEPGMCDDCKVHCEKCDIYMHGKCMAEHATNCNSMARATRALTTARDTITEKKYEIERTKRKLAVLEDEMLAAKESHVEAKEVLRRLKTRR